MGINKVQMAVQQSRLTSKDRRCTSVTSHQAQAQLPTLVFFDLDPQHPPEIGKNVLV